MGARRAQVAQDQAPRGSTSSRRRSPRGSRRSTAVIVRVTSRGEASMRRYGAHTSTGQVEEGVEERRPARPGRGAAAPRARRRAAGGCGAGRGGQTASWTRPGSGRAGGATRAGDGRRDAWRGAQRGGDGVAGGGVGVAGGGAEAGHRTAPRRQRPADGDRDALGPAHGAGCRCGRPAARRARRRERAGAPPAPSPRRASRRRPAPRRGTSAATPASRPAGRRSISVGSAASTPAGGAATTTPNALWAADAGGRRRGRWRRRRGGRRRRRSSSAACSPSACGGSARRGRVRWSIPAARWARRASSSKIA